MQKTVLRYLFVLCSLVSFTTYGQKLKSETIVYNYNRLPSSTLKDVKNYQVTFDAAYETKNKQLLADYYQQKKAADEKYNKDLGVYSSMVRTANERYDKAVTEYNKKSLGSKIVEKSLLDNRKPQREIIIKPYVEYVEKPALQPTYDYQVFADTYIHLDGYQKDPSNALKIVVVLYGFDSTIPRSVNEEETGVSVGNGKSSTSKAIVYHNEFSYRHPMAVKVYSPQGKEMLSVTPPQLNSYKIYKTAKTDRPVSINTELLIKNTQEKVLQENLQYINNLVNDRFGYSSIKRECTLYYIKNGDSNYADLTTAFNEASSGLLLLQQDAPTGITKLQKACTLWNTALGESDINNKKSRINKDITLGIYFNMLESYFAAGDVQSGQNTLDKLNSISLSNSERRTKLDFDVLFAELKSRQSQN